MQFGSIEFLIWFLPLFLIIYYVLPQQFGSLLIVAGSLVFYAFCDYRYLPFVVLLILINYGVLCGIAKKPKLFLCFGVFINLVVLITSKTLNLSVPGISFLTFSLLSCVFDRYRNHDEKLSFMEFSVYAIFFPKVVSGPIMKLKDFSAQIRSRSFELSNIEIGLADFIIGLTYKIVIADQLAGIRLGVNTIGIESVSTPLAWISVFAFSLQIYFDFHGYSRMAIGLGKMLGFTLPENFDAPYFTKSFSQFYRKWHMTLGIWFKDYIYFPLGGNRKSAFRTVFNITLVWLLTSLWHGFSLNFLLWGLTICIFILLEKLFLYQILDKSRVFGHIYVLILVPLTWVLFSVDNVQDIHTYFLRLFTLHNTDVVNTMDFMKYLQHYGVILAVGVLCLFPVVEKTLKRNSHKWWGILILTACFWLSGWLIKVNGSNPFMYFNF